MGDSSLHRALDCLVEGPRHRKFPHDQAKFKAWIAPWLTAPKYVLSRAATSFIDDMPDKERQSVCQSMIRANVFRMPRPELVLEVQHKFRQSSESDANCQERALLIHLREDLRDERLVFLARMIYEDGNGVYHAMPAEFHVEMISDSEFQVSVRQEDWLLDQAEGLRFVRWLSAGNDGVTYCSGLAIDLCSLILLTSTRGVVNTPVETAKSSRRLARLRRVTPEFNHTLVELNPQVKHLAGRTYTVDGRLVPRLHWRRGHQRNQRCGPGRAETRLIWVEAHLVGHSESGLVTHDYSL